MNDHDDTDDRYRLALERVRTLAAAQPPRVIVELLAAEPERLARFTVDAAGLHVDCAKQRIAAADLDALFALARAAGIERHRDDMYAGRAVNVTERRPALHTALRAPAGSPDPAGAPGTARAVQATLARMNALAEEVRGGQWLGAGGRRITDLIHVGIGGSHLGPQLACEALGDDSATAVRVQFLSNVDPFAWERVRPGLDPQTTLAVIASKSWRTDETARNAAMLRRWLLEGGVGASELGKHLVAVTANVAAAREFGVDDAGIFAVDDTVGGRFSLWSAVGLPVVVAIGAERFARMLAGANAMDQHFARAPLEANAPVLLALVSAWNRLALPAASEVILAYCDALRSLPAHLQQLQMESNGKRVDVDGNALAIDTVAATWGGTGTDAQHSFFQALHQGTVAHAIDFVVAVPARADPQGRDRALLANAIAQGAALASGYDAGAAEPHRAHPGNRPSNTLVLGELTPETLGALVALYEHKTAVLGWLWRIDSFDQWGVELGKRLAGETERALGGDAQARQRLDASSLDLLERIARMLAARTGSPPAEG